MWHACHTCRTELLHRPACKGVMVDYSTSWQILLVTALISAGNAGCTLITRSFARQLGLVDMHGNPTQAYSRTIRVQGVVAGAFEMIKTLNITYEIKGELLLGYDPAAAQHLAAAYYAISLQRLLPYTAPFAENSSPEVLL